MFYLKKKHFLKKKNIKKYMKLLLQIVSVESGGFYEPLSSEERQDMLPQESGAHQFNPNRECSPKQSGIGRAFKPPFPPPQHFPFSQRGKGVRRKKIRIPFCLSFLDLFSSPISLCIAQKLKFQKLLALHNQ